MQSVYLPFSKKTLTKIAHPTRPKDFAVNLELPSTSMYKIQAFYISKLISYSVPNNLQDQEQHAEFAWTIHWQYKVAKYKGDLDTYIWQPHARPPPFCHASLFIHTRGLLGVPRAAILFSATRSMKVFRRQYDLTYARFSCVQPSAIGLLHTIHAVYSVALAETKMFLQYVSRQVFDMVGIAFPSLSRHSYHIDQTFQSRVRPSKQKFQHLLFLSDCTKRTALDMGRNLGLLGDFVTSLKKIVPIFDNPDLDEVKVMHKAIDELRDDIEYIKKELEVVEQSINKLRSEVDYIMLWNLPKLTTRQRSNLIIPCKAAIPPCSPF